MGSVVAAFDTTIRRNVAIKIAPAPQAGDVEQQKAFQRFRREAQLAGGLKHPNIVGIHDFGEDSKAAWMVMEIVEGGSLRDLLNRSEAFSIPETVRLMVQVLDGLAFCHDQGIVHCDIKPANIMLTESSTEGEVKLADFGIARRITDHAADAEATRVFSSDSHLDEDRIGTPAYMAPEQFAGGALTGQTDIWAAGVLLYQLLTRENPFKGDPDAIEAQVLNSEPIPPSKLSVLATPAFDALIRQALSKRPQDRFTDARSFAAKLLEATRARRVEPLPSPKSAAAPAAVAATASKGWIKYAAAGGVVAGGLVLFLVLSGGPAPITPPPSQPALVLAPQPPPPRSDPTAPAGGLIVAPNQPPRFEPSPPLPVPPATAPQPQLSRVDPVPAIPPAREPAMVLTPRSEPVRPEPVPAPSGTPSLLLIPAAPAVIPAPPPPDPALRERAMDTALRSIMEQERCGVLDATRVGERVTMSGFIHQRDVPGLSASLTAAGMTPRFTADVFDAPYCGVLSAIRPALATGDALPRLAARSRDLRSGERLTLDLAMPDWAPTVSLWFVMHDGQALRLLEDLRLRPGERRMMNESAPNFPWLIGEPFGHELVLLIASEGQLFDRSRPQEESTETLASALRIAAQRARDQGRRLVMRAIMVETRP